MPVNRTLLCALAVACGPLFFASAAAAADPTKDQCIDANESAQSLRKTGKLREAEQKLRVCVSATCPGPVRDDCATRLTEVRAITPTLVFSVKDDADQDLSDVHVTMDDQPLADKLDGTAIAVNPGPHRFVFESPGRVKQERSLIVRESEKDRRERVVLVNETAAPAPVASPVPEIQQAVPVETHATGPAEGTTQRTAGLVVGGVGVAGLVVGAVFGIVAKSTYNDALKDCPGGTNACTPDGVSGGSNAHSQAAVSTVGFIAGGALAAAGIVLYFTAPHGVAVTPSVGMNSAGVGLSGSW